MKRLIAIIGSTATGKTDLALNLAKKFNGELIACDSRQVYRGLDIGTGKTPGKSEDLNIGKSDGYWEINGIKVWMYDLVEVERQFNAFDWAQKAAEVINEIWGRGKLPIIVGGTGLYLKALLQGLNRSPSDEVLRKQLKQLSLVELQQKIGELSPARWEQLNNSDKNNPRRLIRIIEQVSMYGYIDKSQITNDNLRMANVLKIGLTAPRPVLNSKINQRVFNWFDLGILDEVKKIMGRGVTVERFKELGLEYGLIAEYLSGKISDKDQLINLIQTKTRQYAKRQMTWFKKEADINWFDITTPNWSYRVEKLVYNWYNQE